MGGGGRDGQGEVRSSWVRCCVWLVGELVYEVRPARDGRIGRSAVDEAWGSSGWGGGKWERVGWVDMGNGIVGELESWRVGVGVGWCL